MNLVQYKAVDGLYLAKKESNWSGRPSIGKAYRFNGTDLQDTFAQGWYFLPSVQELTIVERFVKGKPINKRYVLQDLTLKSDKIPERLTPEEVAEYYDEDCNYCWGDTEYKTLRSLYSIEHDQSLDEWVEEPFELESLGNLSISDTSNFVDMKIELYTDASYISKGSKEVDLSSIARWGELEEMLVPEFLLPKRPCSLTSEQTYNIVRHYIKENIAPMIACITADYDFCFTIKKKIAIKPYTRKWEKTKRNGRSYTKPKIRNKTIEYKEVEIFEMTHAGRNYSKYTPIVGFKGESLEDLGENIKLYLDELLHYINQPVTECSHCNGTGNIIDKDFELNKRLTSET